MQPYQIQTQGQCWPNFSLKDCFVSDSKILPKCSNISFNPELDNIYWIKTKGEQKLVIDGCFVDDKTYSTDHGDA